MRSFDPDVHDELAGGGSAGTAVPADDSAYWAFYEQVARRQVLAWAPAEPGRVLDLSTPSRRFAADLAAAGHEVLHACPDPFVVPASAAAPVAPAAPAASGAPQDSGPAAGPGRLRAIRADTRSLEWLADASVDAVLAESAALSRCLATEVTVAGLRRVLRPGGRLLLAVDSLGLGLARLAEQGRWAELADVPRADVVLVPGAGDSIRRCFGPEELVELVTAAGLDVDWVRPRTVLGPAAVERALAHGGRRALEALTATELELAAKRAGDSPGLHLLLSARRPV